MKNITIDRFNSRNFYISWDCDHWHKHSLRDRVWTLPYVKNAWKDDVFYPAVFPAGKIEDVKKAVKSAIRAGNRKTKK